MACLVQIFYLALIGGLLLFGPALAVIAIKLALATPVKVFLLGICVFYGISPLLLAWGGLSLAKLFHCQASSITFQCPDQPWLGNLITWMTFAHWGALFTIPSGLLGCIGLLLTLSLKANS
ncbi:MAG: hypothetical protein F6K58_32530 [Symploca sp. SIO2E9]|nr:hypothetical protein [Symploca sp. SIO2E9]